MAEEVQGAARLNGHCARLKEAVARVRAAQPATSRSSPSTISPYGMRHCCAHWPRLAERPPQASLEKHCPLYETHMWPCTKTSTFDPGTAEVTAAMSSIESSRVSTTVRAPSA